MLPPEPATARVPVVVFLHGGGWRMGSRHSVGPAYAACPARSSGSPQAGIAVASVDYRLSGEATWPAQLHDAKAAVRWLRARAGELGIDPDADRRLGRVGRRPPRRAARPDRGRRRARGRRRHHRPVERRVRRRRLVRAQRHRRRRDRPRRGPGRPAHPRGAAARRPGAARARSSPRRPARSRHVSPGAPPVPAAARRGRPAHPVSCRASGCTPRWSTAGVEVELDLYEGADHMWLGSPEAARQALDRTHRLPAAAAGRPTDEGRQDDEDRGHPPGRRRRGGGVAVGRRHAGDRARRPRGVLGRRGRLRVPRAGRRDRWPADRRGVRAAGAAGRPGDLHRAELPQARRRGHVPRARRAAVPDAVRPVDAVAHRRRRRGAGARRTRTAWTGRAR